jgi:hypothetical protein
MAQITSAAHRAVSLGAPLANFCLARGPGAVPRNLRLAHGPDAASDESPPRSRAGRPLGRVSAMLEAAPSSRPHTHSPDQSIKCSGTTRVPGSKVNPRHAGPLTPLGNHIPALFRQPSPCGHPWHCRGTMREGRCQLHDTMPPTLVRLARHTPRKRTVEPSKRVRTTTPRSRGTTL